VNNSVRIAADDHKARIALAQYFPRPPLSLAKLTYEPSQDKVIFHTSFNPALGENVKVWDALLFIALATRFIPWAAAVSSETARAPPQGVTLIHYYRLYSSHSRWKWPEWDHVAAHAPQGWKENHCREGKDSPQQAPACTLPESACRSSWARLIAQVYEGDPQGGSCLLSKLREPLDLHPMWKPDEDTGLYNRPRRGEKDTATPDEDRPPSPRFGSLARQLIG
jgi:hypothetical protein